MKKIFQFPFEQFSSLAHSPLSLISFCLDIAIWLLKKLNSSSHIDIVDVVASDELIEGNSDLFNIFFNLISQRDGKIVC